MFIIKKNRMCFKENVFKINNILIIKFKLIKLIHKRW